MAISLATPSSRSRLSVRHPPYWKQISRGVSVGYRNKGKPTWYVRRFAAGKYITKAIGAADDAPAKADGKDILTWKDAQKRAFDPATAAAPGRSPSSTVADLGVQYFAYRRAKSSRLRSIEMDEARWRNLVLPKLGTRRADELTTEDLRGWRNALVPPLKVASDEARERQRRDQANANRAWTVLRAALSFAFRDGKVASDVAWQRVEPFKGVGKPRLRFLSVPEALGLLKELDPEFKALAHGALYTGLRLGELLAMKVADVKDRQVHVPAQKTDKARDVPLSKEGAEFFKKLIAGRNDKELAFGMDDSHGAPERDARRVRLGRKMRIACTAAKIAPPAVFHDLRRSYGSLMLNSGASMDLISVALGHADLRMTRQTYAHLSQESLAKAIAKHLPSFDETAQPKKKKRARKPRKAKAA
jgi:integrase